MRLPSSTLLQYHYGVCALKRWGRNADGVDFSNLRQGKALGQGPSVTISSQSRGHTDRAKKIERSRNVSSQLTDVFSEIKEDPDQRAQRMMDVVLLVLSSSSDAARSAWAHRGMGASDARMYTRRCRWVESMETPVHV